MTSLVHLFRHAGRLALSVLLLSSLAIQAAAKELPTTAPKEVGLSSEKLQRVDEALKDLVDKNKVAGAVVMVVRHGKVAYCRPFGMMDIEKKKPMKRDTIFRIYSMTKPITTVAAMMLFDEGKLELDDPVEKYLPEFKDAKVHGPEGKLITPKRPMSVRDLMRHTSGLTYGVFGDTPVDKMYREAKVLNRDTTLAEMARQLGPIPLVHEPVAKWHYSVATDVLGRVVEVVSEKPLDEFFRERIFKPLDMKDTGFYVPKEKLDRFAANYGPNDKGGLKVIDAPTTSRYLKRPKRFSGGGGLVSTIRDYTRFCQMLLGGGQLDGERLLRKETVQRMIRNQLPDEVMPIGFGNSKRHSVGFGLGFSVVVGQSPWDTAAAVGEYGWGGAASTHFWISPKHDLFVVTLQQYMPFTHAIERTVKPLVYGAVVE